MKRLTNKRIREIASLIWLLGLISTLIGLVLFIVLTNCISGIRSLKIYASIIGEITPSMQEDIIAFQLIKEKFLPLGIISWIGTILFLLSIENWIGYLHQILLTLRRLFSKDPNANLYFPLNDPKDEKDHSDGNMDLFFFD